LINTKRLLLSILVLVFLSIQFSGACIRELSYLDDEDLINLAIGREIALQSNHHDRVNYSNSIEFKEKNPDCCTVSRWRDFDGKLVIINKVFFFYVSKVTLLFRSRVNPGGPDRKSYYFYSACGVELDRASVLTR
jgi:hypothetical protein